MQTVIDVGRVFNKREQCKFEKLSQDEFGKPLSECTREETLKLLAISHYNDVSSLKYGKLYKDLTIFETLHVNRLINQIWQELRSA